MELVKLGKVADFINGKAFKPSDWEDKGKKIIRIQNLNDCSKPYNRTLQNVEDKYLVYPNDILVSWSASLGVFEWKDSEIAVLNQHIFKVVPDEKLICKPYLKYALDKSIDLMLKYTHGSTMKHINRQEFLNLEIPLPPIASQRRIANILDKADEIIRKRKEAIALTEQLLKSTFLDMFGDPVTNPKGWEKCQVKDIAKVKTGKTPSRKENDNYGSSIRWVKTTEVINSIIEETEEYLSEKGALQMNVFPEKTIIVAMYGQGKTRGRTALLANPSTTNQACAAILPSYKYNTIYLWELLKLSYYRLRELGRGGNQPNLNLDMIKTFEIIFPPLENQEKFEDIITKIQIQRAKNIKSLEESENLFNSLLQKAFKGEL